MDIKKQLLKEREMISKMEFIEYVQKRNLLRHYDRLLHDYEFNRDKFNREHYKEWKKGEGAVCIRRLKI